MPGEPQDSRVKLGHREQAEAMASCIIDGPQDVRNPGAAAYLIAAQVHASLAIAEQLDRLNGQLEKGVIEVLYGGSTV